MAPTAPALAADDLAADETATDYEYHPSVGTVYAATAAELAQVNKGNAVLYPKSAQLESGRLVATFERSIGDPVGQGVPVYRSDDFGTTWQKLADVQPPAMSSDDPEYAKYTSNWTNPYLYVLPETIGDLAKGTLLMATLVSGDDGYYRDQKSADPSWVPTADGDRQDLAIALYSSVDDGATWDLVNIIGTGGWSADYGRKFASGNTYHQQDPVWEPYLLAYGGQLVAYYTDENDWESFDPNTGVLTERPDNLTGSAPASGLNPGDTGGQILLHKTWDGLTASDWSAPVLDAYDRFAAGVGFTGRPGMTNVVPTTDGKWILTAEFGVWRVSDSPLRFWDAPQQSKSFHNNGGSPVIIKVPNPADPTRWSLVFNNSSSGNDLYVNASGRSDGQWLRYATSIGNGYSRNLQYVPQTGRLVILRGTWGGSPITHTEVDLGSSQGAYYSLVNRKTGQVIGTGGRSQDANFTGNVPDVVLEAAGSSSVPDSQLWHLMAKGDGVVSLLNKSGGRAIAIWQGNAAAGSKLAQWNDEGASDKQWRLVESSDGYYRLQSVKGPSLYATGATAGAAVVIQPASVTDPMSQEWDLVQQAPTTADLSARSVSTDLVAAETTAAGSILQVDTASATTPGGALLHANDRGTVYVLAESSATPVRLGTVRFDAMGKADIDLPDTFAAGAYQIAVLFDATPLMRDALTLVAPQDPALTGEVTVTVDVDATTGGLSLLVPENAVDLGSAQLAAGIDRLVAEGQLPRVRVTDTRAGDLGWSLTGLASAFVASSGVPLADAGIGWTPHVLSTSQGQVVAPGPSVAPAEGLTAGATLARAEAGRGRGTAEVDAGLRAELPTTTSSGTYVATITITLA
ncbi:Ricin-type beta-trefoil lectin domain-like [Sanguibacter gelidistatuariae]|uniref:Ricin-type beta-trefoil lectin domain-like n=1 Tax=Sanguibacter gelidistatuariae TaxID=1814289 RepID=A0A1G6VJJ4_9MICO|nr:RICIN domain-containing protein [Sanguibacter gelidistatuariae]SDD53016.1 Ricin-type beta-trefoil lectin domain-like [Sanguibacter gelidistatuariae]